MSNSKQNHVVHPGLRIREEVIPQNLSVKDAAKILGVGRPALSNLLNGRSSLSSKMAIRIEKAFGKSRKELLNWQSEYKEQDIDEQISKLAVSKYSTRFLEIKAQQIEHWASKHKVARDQLAVLIRRLIHSTGSDLSKVDFPAFDNAERPGWDGEVEAQSLTTWIPEGKSGWEFGVNEDVPTKANRDYKNRISKIPYEQRQEMTFVFVTPRNWKKKGEWAKQKKEENQFKDVKAYDASDLEQWLAQSVSAQSWFSWIIGEKKPDIESIEYHWDQWNGVTTPKLNEKMFSDSVLLHEAELKNWLKKSPQELKIVSADSKEEALAFLHSLIKKIDLKYYDNTVVVSSVEGLKIANDANADLILIVDSEKVEKKLGSLPEKFHTIIVAHKNAIGSDSGIKVVLPSYDAFQESLVAMGVSEREVARYIRESGFSPTVLRRRLSDRPSIKTPPWVKDKNIVKKFTPLILIGSWDQMKKGDIEVVKHITQNEDLNELEKSTRDQMLEQNPFWSIGKKTGVLSKIDSLFTIAKFLTENEIDNFIDLTEIVLSERDPSLDLPDEERYLAGLYNKTRDHSKILRDSLCETLILFSTFGDQLFDFDVTKKVNGLIRRLLTPFDEQTWLSQRKSLTQYAEATPDEFLDLIEKDLKNEKKVLCLLRPSHDSLFGSECLRSNLLWALELLAWKPSQLRRVVEILAQLSRIEIQDNWVNKPINCLLSIFRSWMPQTAANLQQRVKALKAINEKYPEIGWKLCIDQFGWKGMQSGNYNHRPRWKNDASGFGEHDLNKRSEYKEFVAKAFDLAVNWPIHDKNTLNDLLSRFRFVSDENKEKILSKIKVWISKKPSDQDKSFLREQIRTSILGSNQKSETQNSIKEIYEKLESKDPIIKNMWLFENHWVKEPFSDLEKEYDYQMRNQRIEDLRVNALQEIWKKGKLKGIQQLLVKSGAVDIIGSLFAKNKFDGFNSIDFISELLLDSFVEKEKGNQCIYGFLIFLNSNQRNELTQRLIEKFSKEKSDEKILRLIKASPLDLQTWMFIDGLSEDLQKQYWSEVHVVYGGWDLEELLFFIDKLKKANRPKACFFLASSRWDEMDSLLIVQILRECVTKGNEKQRAHFDSYHIKEVFTVLRGRNDVDTDEMIRLELLYAGLLRYEDFSIPNLEKKIAETPKLFVEIISYLYSRSDGAQDPEEWQAKNEDHKQFLGEAAYSILKNIFLIPGTNEDNHEINSDILKKWICDVRLLCEKYARLEIGDQSIGKILSRCNEGKDGVWPCEEVRAVLEEIASDHIMIGMKIEKRNARGAASRGFGGNQERKLAKRYYDWAEKLDYEYPYVANKLLRAIARDYEQEAAMWDQKEDLDRKILQ